MFSITYRSITHLMLRRTINEVDEHAEAETPSLARATKRCRGRTRRRALATGGRARGPPGEWRRAARRPLGLRDAHARQTPARRRRCDARRGPGAPGRPADPSARRAAARFAAPARCARA